ncbi:unnamed protein product [Adineta ricciae]|uniref:G-protein coupled receptors family 1 profile domain-containing protein n=1 Tax=Adineta ricciae TaxID=249248 RepID=A0A814VMN6_ADIRI|nr:unnamed protein product [Adineta ricciae]CAF1189781.1 unnamed protein product [Adineta ricciae]
MSNGTYLQVASIVSLVLTTLLILKFWLFALIQLTLINNDLLTFISCISLDSLLRIHLTTVDWLNACVAIERTVTPIKGVNFNRKKSKNMTKCIILIILLISISTAVYEPFHRHLIDDEEEQQQTCCVVKYTPILQTVDIIVNLVHSHLLFLVNLISAMIIIVMLARKRSFARKQEKGEYYVYDQFWQNKHLLISPCILAILTLPRIIISFLSSCMKSVRDPWLFLIEYYISFVPPMLIFPVFVLPSNVYKEELAIMLKKWAKTLQGRYLHRRRHLKTSGFLLKLENPRISFYSVK